MITETEIVVRYAETDQMGIVHHSNYAVWFEAARTDFTDQLGYRYADMEASGILLPLTDLQCSFKKPARYGQTVVIRTRIERLTGVRIIFAYEVLDRETGELLATGETRHAWTGRDLKPLNLKKKKPVVYEALQGSAED
jgi:acyl-CoA thioester hydrolase